MKKIWGVGVGVGGFKVLGVEVRVQVGGKVNRLHTPGNITDNLFPESVKIRNLNSAEQYSQVLGRALHSKSLRS